MIEGETQDAGSTNTLAERVTAVEADTPVRYPVEVSDKSLMPSWCVVYNDGWCEQGGYASSASAITLLKSFKDTNYTITVALLADANEDYTSKTITGFSIGASGSWQASGYIA